MVKNVLFCVVDWGLVIRDWALFDKLFSVTNPQ
jgi:hypothetical protein